MKLKSDKTFLDFLRSAEASPRLAVILLIGAGLILFGSLGAGRIETAADDPEHRISEMCSLADGVGRCEVMLHYDREGEVNSAIVLCEGADSAEVRARVVSMVASFYGIGTHRIEVVKISR